MKFVLPTEFSMISLCGTKQVINCLRGTSTGIVLLVDVSSAHSSKHTHVFFSNCVVEINKYWILSGDVYGNCKYHR